MARQGQERADSNDFHRQVLLCPGNGRVALPLAFHFLCSQTHSPHDDFAAFENADDTGHGDTADTDALAYWKICSALAWEAVTEELPALTTRSGNNHEMAGTITHHTATEPQQMMSAYFKPTMYPIPSTAAPVLILKTSLVLSASACPHSRQRDVTLSFHQPTVAMMKS